MIYPDHIGSVGRLGYLFIGKIQLFKLLWFKWSLKW